MRKPSRIRRYFKWTLTGLTVLILWGVASVHGTETNLGNALSFETEGGVLTVRTWGTAGGVSQGIPSDDPATHPRGIPDSRSIPIWILGLVLVVPTAFLWWADRRGRAAPAASGRAAHRIAR